jgi:hypothetical protein
LGKERSRKHSQKSKAKEKKRLRNAQRSFPADFDDANFSVDGSFSPSVNASPGIAPSGGLDDPPHVHVACELSSRHCSGATTEGRPETRREGAIPAARLPTVVSAERHETRAFGEDTGHEGDGSLTGVVSAELPGAKSCLTDSHREAMTIENPEEVLWNLEISLGGVVLDGASVVNSPILPYVRMVVSVIAGERISKEELFAGLLKIVSQRSIDQRANTRYVSRFLDQHPP